MRIISGKHRGRNIKTREEHVFRPTTSRTREAIFSIITSGNFLNEDLVSVLENATVMDLCCGSGSLGLEALSRGASKLIAIDIEQDAINMVRDNAADFGETDNVILIRADACTLPKAKITCDIVFIDPPYDKKIISPALESLTKQGWLKEKSLVILEIDKKQLLEKLDSYKLIHHRIYGKTQIYILEYESNQL